MRKKSGRTKVINGEKYITTGAAAEILGISKGTLLQFCRNRQIQHLPLGGVNAFKKEWLADFVNERTQFGAYRGAKK